MIELIKNGDILRSAAHTLVNAVNCVGVMGKGLAIQFKAAFPAMFASYAVACRLGELGPGRLHTFELPDGRWVVNLPTKRHWREPSRLEDVEAGLLALVEWVDARKISSVAVPALGCTNGGLPWAVIRPMIEAAFFELPHVRVELYSQR